MGLEFGEASQPPPESAASLLSAVQRCAVGLFKCMEALHAAAGPTLREHYVAVSKKACETLVSIIKMTEKKPKGSQPSPEELKRAVGRVWDTCDEIAKGPADDKTALFKRLAQSLKAVQSARGEVRQRGAGG